MPGFSSSNTNNYYSILTLWYSPNDSKVEFYWVWSKRFLGQSIMSRGVAGGGGALVSCCVTRRPAELTKTHQDLLTRLVAAGPPHRNGLSSCSQLFSHLSHYPLLATRFFSIGRLLCECWSSQLSEFHSIRFGNSVIGSDPRLSPTNTRFKFLMGLQWFF